MVLVWQGVTGLTPRARGLLWVVLLLAHWLFQLGRVIAAHLLAASRLFARQSWKGKPAVMTQIALRERVLAGQQRREEDLSTVFGIKDAIWSCSWACKPDKCVLALTQYLFLQHHACQGLHM